MGLRTRRLGTRYKQEEVAAEDADNSNHVIIIDMTSVTMLIGIGD